jgi:hypothetical protein
MVRGLSRDVAVLAAIMGGSALGDAAAQVARRPSCGAGLALLILGGDSGMIQVRD